MSSGTYFVYKAWNDTLKTLLLFSQLTLAKEWTNTQKDCLKSKSLEYYLKLLSKSLVVLLTLFDYQVSKKYYWSIKLCFMNRHTSKYVT